MQKITQNKSVIASFVTQANIHQAAAQACIQNAWAIVEMEHKGASTRYKHIDLLTWKITENPPGQPESTLSLVPTAGKAD